MNRSGDAAAPEGVKSATASGSVREPRFGLFLCDCIDATALDATLRRIPAEVHGWLREVVVMVDGPDLEGVPALTASVGECAIRLHQLPRRRGYGGLRKAAFEYARRVGIEFVITLEGDGSDPPEHLPELIDAALDSPRDLIVASADHGFARSPGRALSAFVQRRALGLKLSDFRSGYRILPTAALERLPYQLNSNDELFELEVVIQFRALGAAVRQVRLASAARQPRAGAQMELRACATAVGYRLHQLHFTRDGRYLVERDVRYTLKHSPTGSHMQIVSSIRSGSRVLDLGCSQGLLAAPLRGKEVGVVGVDAGPGEGIATELDRYFQRDLDEPLDLPLGRDFDYVVVADVIEHLRHRQALLRDARRFLKPNGRLIISTGNVAIWFYRLSLAVGRFEYGPRGILDDTHLHLYTGASFRREVEKAGFQVLEQRVTALPFEVVFESTGRSRLIHAAASAYHALARIWPSLFAYQFILEAQITTLDEESPAAERRGTRSSGGDRVPM